MVEDRSTRGAPPPRGPGGYRDAVSQTRSEGPLTTLLAGRTLRQLTDFFTGTPAVEITDLIRTTGDAELAPLVADPHVRAAAVLGILHRFPEFAEPERLALLDGSVRFDLAVPGGTRESHVLGFSADGVVMLVPEASADVTIRAGVLDFVRLVTGERNAALLYLRGDLEVDGEETLALAVGTVFRLPGTGEIAVDPTALDPVDVATAVAASSVEHLRSVMGGGFREVVLGEVFRRFPDFLRPDKAARVRLSVGFRIGGRGDGDADRYLVRIDHGDCAVQRDPADDARRDATLILDGVDFLRLITGQLNPVAGVLRGTMKVRGDKAKALALNTVMERPRPT